MSEEPGVTRFFGPAGSKSLRTSFSLRRVDLTPALLPFQANTSSCASSLPHLTRVRLDLTDLFSSRFRSPQAEDSSPPSSSGQPTSRPSPHDPYANAFSSSSNLDDLHFGLSQTPSGLTDSFPFEGAPASTQVSLEVLKSYLPSRELAWSLAETYYRVSLYHIRVRLLLS